MSVPSPPMPSPVPCVSRFPFRAFRDYCADCKSRSSFPETARIAALCGAAFVQACDEEGRRGDLVGGHGPRRRPMARRAPGGRRREQRAVVSSAPS
eukprot:954941-Pleurochrysis_carterae.AAC.1